jgi:Rrf2 family cysteine metabolism transcriptional repressor
MEDRMKLLTKETDYAIRGVMHLARREGHFIPSRTISEQEHIPLHFLRRILQALIRNSFVESREGVSGGVRLKAAPQKIRLADLIRIFQGDIQLSECMFRKRICANRKTCVLRRRIGRIEQMVTTAFEGITIGDLLNDMEVD